jgi:hypothetical protein
MKHKTVIILMTHNCVLHATLSELDPEQVAPPFAGVGLLQSLV